MEEELLKIIGKHDYWTFGSEDSAKEITSMVMEFMDWLMDEADIGNSVWDIGDGEDYSSGEVFDYWIKHIRKP